MINTRTQKDKLRDPVCGMPVDKDSAFTLNYRGKDYRFCSDKCKTLFEQEPELFIAMKESREELIEEERAESLKKMADELTHEIRNPLTSIGGFARRIYKNLPEDAPYREYMQRVIEDVDRLEKMISRLVQIETGHFNIKHSDINEIINNVIKSFEEDFRNNNINITLDLKGAPLILLDREKIRSIFVNLIKNAIEAMERDPKEIKITSNIEDSHVVISVSDTGKGIPDDKIKYIFDPFFTSKIYGPGLGLTFVKEVIQAHGGDIKVKSMIGKGTTFTIRLPLHQKGNK